MYGIETITRWLSIRSITSELCVSCNRELRALPRVRPAGGERGCSTLLNQWQSRRIRAKPRMEVSLKQVSSNNSSRHCRTLGCYPAAPALLLQALRQRREIFGRGSGASPLRLEMRSAGSSWRKCCIARRASSIRPASAWLAAMMPTTIRKLGKSRMPSPPMTTRFQSAPRTNAPAPFRPACETSPGRAD